MTTEIHQILQKNMKKRWICLSIYYWRYLFMISSLYVIKNYDISKIWLNRGRISGKYFDFERVQELQTNRVNTMEFVHGKQFIWKILIQYKKLVQIEGVWDLVKVRTDKRLKWIINSKWAHSWNREPYLDSPVKGNWILDLGLVANSLICGVCKTEVLFENRAMKMCIAYKHQFEKRGVMIVCW